MKTNTTSQPRVGPQKDVEGGLRPNFLNLLLEDIPVAGSLALVPLINFDVLVSLRQERRCSVSCSTQ